MRKSKIVRLTTLTATASLTLQLQACGNPLPYQRGYLSKEECVQNYRDKREILEGKFNEICEEINIADGTRASNNSNNYRRVYVPSYVYRDGGNVFYESEPNRYVSAPVRSNWRIVSPETAKGRMFISNSVDAAQEKSQVANRSYLEPSRSSFSSSSSTSSGSYSGSPSYGSNNTSTSSSNTYSGYSSNNSGSSSTTSRSGFGSWGSRSGGSSSS